MDHMGHGHQAAGLQQPGFCFTEKAVDVNIQITEDSGSNALGKVRKYARELKHNLETELHQIESARVYLDLNGNDEDDEHALTALT